jgi:hypothetical protein
MRLGIAARRTLTILEYSFLSQSAREDILDVLFEESEFHSLVDLPAAAPPNLRLCPQLEGCGEVSLQRFRDACLANGATRYLTPTHVSGGLDGWNDTVRRILREGIYL